jgi:hypothetical protein
MSLTFAKLCIAVFVAGVAAQADASLIKLETGYSVAGAQSTSAAYRTVVNAAVQNPTAGYGTTTLTSYDGVNNTSQFGSNRNFAWEAIVNFGVSAAQAGTWTFRSGVDFDFGGTMYVDNVAIALNSNNMWWAGSYNDTSQYLMGSLNLAAGNHTLQIYGIEGCCDAFQQTQFKAPNTASFVSFSSTDGLNVVPEPGTLASMALGLGVIAALRRRRT